MSLGLPFLSSDALEREGLDYVQALDGMMVLLPYSLKWYHLAPALLQWIRQFRFGRSYFHEATALLRRTSLHLVDDVCVQVSRANPALQYPSILDRIFASTPLERAMVVKVCLKS